MAEYIEREALLSDFGEEPMVWTDSDSEIQERFDWYKYKGIVEEQPAADVAPVVHGRWIEKPFLLGTSNFCSLCDSFYGMPHGKFNYCPNCGAKMEA